MGGLSAAESGFLLLTSKLGVPERKPLSVAQLRKLSERVRTVERRLLSDQIGPEDFLAMGYSPEAARHMWSLLQEEELLAYYLEKARKSGCSPITRGTQRYPLRARKALGLDAPGCLWAKGELELLDTPKIALVGSRELGEKNREFAHAVGTEAARQGYTLVSGNARGADKTAQQACLAAGGRVISVVADSLESHRSRDRLLYLSEDSFDLPFSARRALSRNRLIHAMADRTFVAQATLHMGGTWDGTVKNLRQGWSSVFCLDDGSEAAKELLQLGAVLVGLPDLRSFGRLQAPEFNIFEME